MSRSRAQLILTSRGKRGGWPTPLTPPGYGPGLSTSIPRSSGRVQTTAARCIIDGVSLPCANTYEVHNVEFDRNS